MKRVTVVNIIQHSFFDWSSLFLLSTGLIFLFYNIKNKIAYSQDKEKSVWPT